MIDPSYRRELLSLIINAGLEEDFIEWLSIQGIRHLVGQVDNIPEELLLAYVKEKKLIDTEEEDEMSLREPSSEPDGNIYIKRKG
ncbi:hypothetical protein [Desulfurococcus amylolyticus]|uniref:hypothetical protein n=1 Tax=Desulfurococcus amylolyticus TaxID=94694 RepID=UPI0005B233A7|nr:hypothetical protein [Desulfurococcus amylolyticus]